MWSPSTTTTATPTPWVAGTPGGRTPRTPTPARRGRRPPGRERRTPYRSAVRDSRSSGTGERRHRYNVTAPGWKTGSPGRSRRAHGVVPRPVYAGGVTAGGRPDTYTHGHQEAVLRARPLADRRQLGRLPAAPPAPGFDPARRGCGPGSLTIDLARRTAPGRVIGIDLSDGGGGRSRGRGHDGRRGQCQLPGRRLSIRPSGGGLV